MGDRYLLTLDCAWCGAPNDAYYALSSDYESFVCPACEERNYIRQKFEATLQPPPLWDRPVQANK